MIAYIVLLSVIIIIVAFRLQRPVIIGSVGEKKIAIRLLLSNTNDDRIINNILLKSDGKTSQIDHLLISSHGIFVIETKNYNGWIYGNEKNEYWTKVLYKNKYQFRNPVKQNWSHIYLLKEILKAYKGIKYYPIVVFSNNSELKEVVSSVPVVYENELHRTIQNLKEHGTICIENIESVENVINQNAIKTVKDKHIHVKQIKENIRYKEKMEEQGICPKCGNRLVERSGPYGKFFGCSGFPRCKYTKKV